MSVHVLNQWSKNYTLQEMIFSHYIFLMHCLSRLHPLNRRRQPRKSLTTDGPIGLQGIKNVFFFFNHYNYIFVSILTNNVFLICISLSIHEHTYQVCSSNLHTSLCIHKHTHQLCLICISWCIHEHTHQVCLSNLHNHIMYSWAHSPTIPNLHLIIYSWAHSPTISV